MSRSVQIHSFEVFGDAISMYGVSDVKLVHIEGNRYKFDEHWVWEKVGPVYIRLGGEHGFMIIKDYDLNELV